MCWGTVITVEWTGGRGGWHSAGLAPWRERGRGGRVAAAQRSASLGEPGEGCRQRGPASGGNGPLPARSAGSSLGRAGLSPNPAMGPEGGAGGGRADCASHGPATREATPSQKPFKASPALGYRDRFCSSPALGEEASPGSYEKPIRGEHDRNWKTRGPQNGGLQLKYCL